MQHISGPEAFSASFEADAGTLGRLAIYAETLTLWQKRINLVSPATIPDLWHRHIADSAQVLALAPEPTQTWADLGSGAGFPGLVVAILLAGRGRTTRVTLVESDQRKCAFMAEVVRKTELLPLIPVDILCSRIEDAATRDRLGQVDVVSARALAPLDRLLGLAAPLLGTTGVGLFLKGRGAEAEIEAAARQWQFAYEVAASWTDADARVVIVRGSVVRAQK